MRLRTTLFHIAVLASTGCGSCLITPTTPDAATEAGHADASLEGGAPEAECGGCNCGGPSVPSGDASPEVACQIARGQSTNGGFSTACETFCTGLNGGGGGFYCTLPPAYATAYQNAQVDAGDAGNEGGAGDAGADGGGTCPTWSGDVVIQCGYQCLGRRTEGAADPERALHATLGSILAERAYLEAVSVQAFARLERELAAHGAPPTLLREARRARRDELRHAAMMARLARRHDGTVLTPEAPPVSPVRPLFAVAMENAIEGCVRETYGAVVGLVEARTSTDPELRRAMRSISADECRHAELAWEVYAWILPRLTPAEREALDRAVEGTVAELASEGDARLVELLASRVWKHPVASAVS